MADLIAPIYSKRQIVEAGKAIRDGVPYDPDRLHEAKEVFNVIHNWRACHLLPMQHMRRELIGKAGSVCSGATTAARMKRLLSIRRKLRSAPYTFFQMQDIAGCRAIVDSVQQVKDISGIYKKKGIHEYRGEDDYISSPRETGYRSHHLIYRYVGTGEYVSLNKKPIIIEIQIRTRLQHAWATAVEAVGMVNGEDNKGGYGNEDWLRLFALMSSEIAREEGCGIVPGTPEDGGERKSEIVNLDRKLRALETLSSYNKAFKIAENIIKPGSKFYFITFDSKKNTVSVSPVSRGVSMTGYEYAEKNEGDNTVLVEVDRAADLRTAYPNYFLDVDLFCSRLREIVKPTPKRSLELDWLRKAIEGWRK
ncbi:MAG: RelA/SpoT domain-containing protein [Sphingosinicella sp.]|nr:RelA/SpoT domain-containing protein [Sphingosinicella sp.]